MELNKTKITKQEVKKHVATIHCSNTLSLLQRKVSNALLYYAYPRLQVEDEHQITIKQLCHIIGYQGHNHVAIKNAVRGLITTLIEWNVINEQGVEEDWTASTILASVRLKGSHCYYAYSPRMKALLYSPSVYGKINLIVQARFKSNYGLALYENCVRYKGLEQSRWFDIETFRRLMGVPDNKYPIFRDFKRRVLDKAVEEVNSYSDLVVTPELNRRGRQVVAIRFLIKERLKKQRLGENVAHDLEDSLAQQELQTDDVGLLNKLESVFGLRSQHAQSIVREYGADKVAQKIQLIEQSASYQKGSVINLSAYLLSALKKDFQAPISSKKSLDTNRRDKAKVAKQNELLQQQQRKLEQQYEAYIANAIDNALTDMDPTIQGEILNAFDTHLATLQDQFIINKYQRNGLSDKVVKVFFRNYVRDHYQNHLPNLISLEDYLK